MYARDYRRIARDRLAGHWWLSVAVALVASLLGGAIGGSSLISFRISTDMLEKLPQEILPIVMAIFSFSGTLGIAQFLLGGAMSLGNARYLLDQDDGLTLQFKTLFSKFDQFGAAFLMKLLTGIYTFLWMLLFIIPGMIASLSYAMAPFIMAENPDMKANAAIRRSKELMDGHKWELFCLDFSFIGWGFLCILTLGIGMLFLAPYKAAAYAAFYRRISGPVVE